MEAVNMPNRIYNKLINDKRIEYSDPEKAKQLAADETNEAIQEYIEGGGV